MTLPNPKQTYKAILLDYDALLAKTDQECSYCLSEREIAMLMPMVDYIAWKTRYIATETEIDTELISKWSGNLARKLMSGCCGDDGTQHRITESGVWQTSPDGGTTWYDDPTSDPRNNANYFPPLEGTDGSSKRCEAATSGMEFFKQNLIDQLATGLTYAEIYNVIVGLLAVAGITGIGIVVAILAAGIFVAGVLAVQAAFTGEVWTDFKCILYCNMSDDASFTLEQWVTVMNEIITTYTGVVQIVLWNWVKGLGYIGLTNVARSHFAAGGDCSPCGCDCAYSWSVWDGPTHSAPPDTYGVILEQETNRVRVEFTGNYITLLTDDIDHCCTMVNAVKVGGTGDFYMTAYNECGVPFTGGAFNNPTNPLNQSVWIWEFQALGADRPIVDVFFAPS
jgi:hypothetical protein